MIAASGGPVAGSLVRLDVDKEAAVDPLLTACEAHTAGLESLARLSGEVVRAGSAVGVFTGLPFPPFNGIHIWRGEGDARTDIASLVAVGEKDGLAMTICAPVGAPQEASVERAAIELGFAVLGGPAPAMILTDLDVPPLPDGVTSVRAMTAADLAAPTRFSVEVFGMPREVAEAATDASTLTWDDLEWFTLWAGGEPVATAMLFLADDTANIFNVAVPAAHRRKGFGAAATWEAVRCGRERGAVRSTLVASVMGAPVYTRMGFETAGHVRTFVRV
ncbi:MAG: GNAT family N-acetyltransferase [Ilumatobacteraceae bacterium]|nr:GNAT family N-acetyltransferase [Ilumatobacteraceae bacterium]